MRRMRSFLKYSVVLIPVCAAFGSLGYFGVKWGWISGNSESSHSTASKSLKTEKAKPKASEQEFELHAKAHSRKFNADASGDSEAEPEDNATFERKPASVPEKAARGECLATEAVGDRMDRVKVSDAQWRRLMSDYHASKAKLLSWLKANESNLSSAAYQKMEKAVKDLRIHRPGSTEEPELSWRGIGVYAQNAQNGALIRLGGGFLKTYQMDPARARFELTRLLAQAWAPCELKRAIGEEPWTKVAECLGVQDADACAIGSFSEQGWAISTAIAYELSRPGCQVPAFKDSSLQACLKGIQSAAGLREPAGAQEREEGPEEDDEESPRGEPGSATWKEARL